MGDCLPWILGAISKGGPRRSDCCIDDLDIREYLVGFDFCGESYSDMLLGLLAGVGTDLPAP